MKTASELNKTIEPREAKLREERDKEEATIRKTLAEKANELLDKVLHPPDPIKAEPAELASAAEIAEVVHKANLDLTAFDAAERDYNLHVKKVNDAGTNGHKIVLSRMAAAFPEVHQGLFDQRSHEQNLLVDQTARALDELARAKTNEVMAPHAEPLRKLWTKIAEILEVAADAKIEAENQAFQIAESERQSKERAAFDAGARQRFLKGHDDHKFAFKSKTFTPSALPARLLETAKRLRQFVYVPNFGNRPSAAPLHGLLTKALLSHPGGK